MRKKQIIVVGGGPAGLMAAGLAALKGAEVIVLEKMARPAIKLAVTGNKRCNITNLLPIYDYEKYIRTNFRFLKHALYSFNNQDLVGFLQKIGLKTVIEEGGKVFPFSQKADDVCNTLVEWVKKSGVKIFTGVCVNKIILQGAGFRVEASDRDKEKGLIYEADAIIIATGGVSYPKTGSSGDGYRLAKELGHNIVPVRPALIPLETFGDTAKHLQGLSLSNIKASIWVDGKKTVQKFGEMLFTHFGLSGPVILSLSSYVVDALAKKAQVSVRLDLMPDLDEKELDARLIKDINQNPKQQIQNLLKQLLPKRMIQVCMDMTKIKADKLVGIINAEERKCLRLFLKGLSFDIKTSRPIQEAIVTAGGVDIKEIDPKTMASKLVKGLYFVGEVLDVDADTGGFNLQIAFSTAWLVGKNIL